MTGDKGKRILINLSSSDEFSDDHIDVTSSSSEDDCQLIDDDDFRSSENEDEDEDESDDSCEVDGDDELTLFNQVLRFLQEKRDLQDLSLKACKSYLRKHGLRVSGNKDECVQRVLEHWRMKDNEAEVLYPRSCFNINCTGDVCRGDIVLFTQKVYGRNGKLLGKRTIAGRVVKESYGAAKQQHTFTVDVLWSKGVKKLPLLFPLLVKGRNLYRLNTFRQPWKNEGERKIVLDEKHRRGSAARLKRDKRKNAWPSGKGLKSQQVCHGPRSSKMNSRGGKDLVRTQGGSSSKHTTNNTSQKETSRHTVKTKFSNPYEKHQITTLRTHHTASWRNQNPPGGFHYRNMPIEPGCFLHTLPIHDSTMWGSATLYTGSFHNSGYAHPPVMSHENYLQHRPSRIASGHQQYGLSRCSMLGCIGPGSDRCVIAACWRCCRREGLICNVHR